MTEKAALIESGTLPVGITVDDVVHRAFTLRPAKVIHSIEAIDLVGSHNPVAISAAILARQLVSLGTLKADQVNYELICEMDPRDYNALEASAGVLAKKALPESAASTAGSASGLPSADSGSTGPKQAS